MDVVEHRTRAMASEVHVIVVGDPAGLVPAMARLDVLEAHWSRFVDDSDISRINRGGGRWVEVADDTIVLVAAMAAAWERTGGRYDPTVLPLVVAAGYAASITDPHAVSALPPGTLRHGAMGEVEIDAARCAVRVPPGVALDPGGIGKGLAADLLASDLMTAGATGACVSIGGDLAMRGRSADPVGWLVELEAPEPGSRLLGRVAVDRGGVATSSTRSRTWRHEGTERHHVIDPVLGAPSTTDLATVTVFAGTGWLAEAHATAALLAGSADVIDDLQRHGLSGVAVGVDGTVRVTSDLADVVGHPVVPQVSMASAVSR